MELATAREIAQEITDKLRPYCDRLEVAGSIRRGKAQVRDVDLVLIPGNQGRLAMFLHTFGASMNCAGQKVVRRMYRGVQVDIYIATPATWATLLLIRTGSREHNIYLCTMAKNKGWKLKADGSGLFNVSGERIAGDTEQSIFSALGLPYVPAGEREV